MAIRGFIIEYINCVRRDNATGLAAQLAYYFLLSLFPFLIFSITLLGYMDISTEDVLSLAGSYIPEQVLHPIQENIRNVLETRKSGLLSFGILLTIWSSSNAMNAIIGALNRAYDVQESRSFIVTRVVGIFLTLMMLFIVLVALMLPVFGKWIGMLVFWILGISPAFERGWQVIRWAFSSLVMMIGFVCIFYLAPNQRIRLKEAAIGAAFTAMGWQVLSLGFSYYVDNFNNYSATYGSLGTAIILLVWLYLIAFIIILGGELNAMIHRMQPK